MRLEVRFHPLGFQTLTPERLDNDAAMAAVTEDLSIGGAFLLTDAQLPTGSRVMVELTLPSSWEPVLVIGEVRWRRVDPPGLGVAFVDTTAEAHVALGQLLTALSFEDE